MNSKDKFMQGTNLFLVPVRGVALVILIMQSSFPRWSPSKNNNILDEIANGGGVLDPSLDHQINHHEVARRQPLLLQ